jgi:hypothetical protein
MLYKSLWKKMIHTRYNREFPCPLQLAKFEHFFRHVSVALKALLKGVQENEEFEEDALEDLVSFYIHVKLD